MLIYGTRVSLVVGVTTGLATAFLGALMGVLTGYLGGIVDMVVMRVVDILLVIPTLPLTIVLTNLFGKSYFMIIFIFTIFGWTGLARVVRSQVLVLKTATTSRRPSWPVPAGAISCSATSCPASPICLS